MSEFPKITTASPLWRTRDEKEDRKNRKRAYGWLPDVPGQRDHLFAAALEHLVWAAMRSWRSALMMARNASSSATSRVRNGVCRAVSLCPTPMPQTPPGRTISGRYGWWRGERMGNRRIVVAIVGCAGVRSTTDSPPMFVVLRFLAQETPAANIICCNWLYF